MFKDLLSLLQVAIIPVLAWVIAIERRLSRLEGRLDILIRQLNEHRNEKNTE